MITLIVLFYVPVLVLSDKFLGSLYPAALIIVVPSFLYLVIKKGISKLFDYDEIILDMLDTLFKLITACFFVILFIIFSAALAWYFWSLVFN